MGQANSESAFTIILYCIHVSFPFGTIEWLWFSELHVWASDFIQLPVSVGKQPMVK